MPFVEKLRQFFLRSQGEKCQTLVYDEKRGWHTCDSKVDLEVDHLTPESELLIKGTQDPNHTEGIVRCQTHHTGRGIVFEDNGTGRIANYGEADWSRHPDIYQAREDYRAGDDDAFKKAAALHQLKAKRGERFTNDDEGVTEFERQRVQEMSLRHSKKEPKPQVKNHTKFERRHWTDMFFGRNIPKEDQPNGHFRNSKNEVWDDTLMRWRKP